MNFKRFIATWLFAGASVVMIAPAGVQAQMAADMNGYGAIADAGVDRAQLSSRGTHEGQAPGGHQHSTRRAPGAGDPKSRAVVLEKGRGALSTETRPRCRVQRDECPSRCTEPRPSGSPCRGPRSHDRTKLGAIHLTNVIRSPLILSVRWREDRHVMSAVQKALTELTLRGKHSRGAVCLFALC